MGARYFFEVDTACNVTKSSVLSHAMLLSSHDKTKLLELIFTEKETGSSYSSVKKVLSMRSSALIDPGRRNEKAIAM
tara:strand:+ start:416 stop:646 length:231 start_codon:yes stop_codon:yes gene_type:complete